MINMTCASNYSPITNPVLLAVSMPADTPREKDGLLDARLAGEFIRQKMTEKGMQIQQLAEKIGIGNPSQLSNLLAGRSNIARSSHFRAIANELGLNIAEIEYLNPNIVWTHPEAAKLPKPIVDVVIKKALPAELKAAVKAVKAIPGYDDMSEDMARRMLPQGLDGKGPQTEAQWVEFLIAMKRFLS